MVSDSKSSEPNPDGQDRLGPADADSSSGAGTPGVSKSTGTASARGSSLGAGQGAESGGMGLGRLDLAGLTERLAAPDPIPGAGCGAAAVAALGSSLVSMAFRRSSDEGASSQPAYMGGRADALDRLTAEFRRLIDADAEAYGAFLAARALDSSGDAAAAKRQVALESAARATVEVPFEILEAAMAALRLAAVGAPDQHQNLLCETATGALALWGAVESCVRIVRDNLPIAAVESASFADQHGRALSALQREAQNLLTEVRRATEPDDGSSSEA